MHHPEIRQRDLDGMFDVVTGDTIAGPFPTIAFAIQIAAGNQPAPAPVATFRHFKVIREVRRDA
jgi:hypothetical protein